MATMMYDLAIIGGGPAGVAAGVYAARKRLKTVFITKDFLSQSTVSLDIQNWIGTQHVTGEEFAKNLEGHLREYSGEHLVIQKGEWVKDIKKSTTGFEIITDKATHQAKTVLMTAGSRRRELDVPGAKEFDNKGLTYCASCDGPLFAGMDVAVVGGGNAGFDSAAQLLAYCNSVTLFARNDFKADEITVQKTLQNPKFKAFKNTDVVEVKGEKFVSSIVYKNRDTNETVDLPVKGIFVEVGSIPNTDSVKNILELDATNHIKVDPWNQRTSAEGIWAAGDATNGLFHQNNIAAGDGVKALEDIYLYIHKM